MAGVPVVHCADAFVCTVQMHSLGEAARRPPARHITASCSKLVCVGLLSVCSVIFHSFNQYIRLTAPWNYIAVTGAPVWLFCGAPLDVAHISMPS